jgi:hypothetical protein
MLIVRLGRGCGEDEVETLKRFAAVRHDGLILGARDRGADRRFVSELHDADLLWAVLTGEVFDASEAPAFAGVALTLTQRQGVRMTKSRMIQARRCSSTTSSPSIERIP